MRLRASTPTLSALSALLAVSVLLTGSLMPATSTLTALPAAATASESATRLLGSAAAATHDVLALSDELAQASSFAPSLAKLASVRVPEPLPPSRDLPEALGRLAVAAGAPADLAQPAGFSELPPATQAGLATLVDGLLESARLMDLAFARLAADDAAFLRANLLLLDLPASGDAALDARAQRAAALAAQVDATLVRAAGLALLSAMEAIPAEAAAAAPPPSLGQPQASAAAAGLLPGWTNPSPSTCTNGALATLVDGTGLLEVGFGSDDTYLTERAAIFDAGGNDCYENWPGSFGPGTQLAVPASAILEFAGNDDYVTASPHPLAPAGTGWASGVGIGGVGIILERHGEDEYLSQLTNEPDNCGFYGGSAAPAPTSWQRLYTQGVGMLGVGIVTDLNGNDDYLAASHNSVASTGCAVGRSYTFGQGLGARFGLGALVDDAGDDEHALSATARGKAENGGHAQGQGAGAGRGVGVLVNLEGHDTYDAGSVASTGILAGTEKANYASTFAQGSLYGANEPRLEQVAGLQTGLAFTPATACAAFSFEGSVGTVPVSAALPCDLQAVGLLVEGMGIDRYNARATASDGGRGCSVASWAGVSAQGSAPTKGLAALVDASVDEINAFGASAASSARDCPALGVRAGTYGQGYGGSILWDHGDRPPFDPLLVTDAAIGLLLRGGACMPNVQLPTLPPTTASIVKDVIVASQTPCDRVWSSDSYAMASSAANSGNGISWSYTLGQGAGNGKTSYAAPGVPNGSVQHDALGIGVTADVSGQDAYSASASASASGTPWLAEALVGAQAAGLGGAGVLANIGGDDAYAVSASSTGSSTQLGQVSTQTVVVSVTVCVPPAGTNCVTVTHDPTYAVLVEVLGRDSYSEGCGQDGLVPNPWFWGNILDSGSGCGPWAGFAQGVDLNT